jgi:hypothetical protein
MVAKLMARKPLQLIRLKHHSPPPQLEAVLLLLVLLVLPVHRIMILIQKPEESLSTPLCAHNRGTPVISKSLKGLNGAVYSSLGLFVAKIVVLYGMEAIQSYFRLQSRRDGFHVNGT